MHLAQLNIAKAKYSLDSAELKEFMDNLEPINKLAESSKGFVWRLMDESGDATSIQAFDDPNIIVNMSVWESADHLKEFMYKSNHMNFLKRKREWFQRGTENNYVLWWIPKGNTPTLEEAVERLMYLRENAETPFAFSLKSNFQPADIEAVNT